MRGPTLGEAIALHLRAMRAKRCAPRSLETLREETARHLCDWLDRPLAALRRDDVARRHESLSDERGPYVANRVMQQLRAVYNTAARRFEELPPTNPVIAVTFNRVRRRREPIPWNELPAWRARVDALSNPVRRELQLFLLFTGLRSLDARTVRWEHVDLAAGTLHRPRPKGGEERAFTVPLSSAALAVLRRRHVSRGEALRGARSCAGGGVGHAGPAADEDDAAAAADDGWVFPTRDRASRVTHVQEPKEQRLVAGRKVRHLPSPHRLRDTFASAAHEAGVHPLDLKVLMNHVLPGTGDVTEGYIRPSVAHLRASAEAIGAFLEARMGGGGLTDQGLRPA